MPLRATIKEELNRARRAAKTVIDEGRVRLEAMRARQLADHAAQALGYAVFRARQGGTDVDQDTYARLADTLGRREAEAKALEGQIETLVGERKGGGQSKAPSGPAA